MNTAIIAEYNPFHKGHLYHINKMVLELPVEYATGSADVFAFGAIDIINKSNFIDTLSFGSESGDITAFSDLADVLNTEPEEFKTL